MTGGERDATEASQPNRSLDGGRFRNSIHLRLGLASFLMLFVELTLIRGAAANIVYLSWFTNFVLLASFLGIGVGFLRVDPSRDRFRRAPWVLLGLGAFILLFPVWVGPSAGNAPPLLMLGGLRALPPWVELPIVFAGVVAAMASLADEVARCFIQLSPLEAYRWDIGGSLAGIVGFSLLSYFSFGPAAWGIVIGAALYVLLPRPIPRSMVAALLIFVAGMVAISVIPRSTWSPYNRVTWRGPTSTGEVSIRVNGRPFQTMIPVSQLVSERPFYGYPYTHLSQTTTLNDVLVIGAGSGDDVALALSMGAKHVDAVEIDPSVVRLGRRFNPTDPYGDPRVAVHVNDGRAFLQQTSARYDLILFALPDSLTLVSGQGGLRLESYLFTMESVEAARSHLAPSGVLAMYNYYSPLVFDRYAETMTQVFGHPPCIDRGIAGGGLRSQSVLTESISPGGISCNSVWHPTGPVPAPSTDNHPFPYIQGHSIPTFYLVSLLLILLASLLIVRGSGTTLAMVTPYWDLFLMGSAFLLLETKNVVSFALLFGTTWFVNSLVFAAILLSVLAAIEVVQRSRRIPNAVLYGLLFASLALMWAIHPESLLGLAPLPRFLAAGALAFAPVFFANIIFAERFKETASSTAAFGANLLGAIAGGALEYAAIIVGYRSLTIIVAALYLAAFLTSARRGRSVAGNASP